LKFSEKVEIPYEGWSAVVNNLEKRVKGNNVAVVKCVGKKGNNVAVVKCVGNFRVKKFSK
jgi:hypothetical protein